MKNLSKEIIGANHVDSLDHNLIIAQMVRGELPFNGRDDLSPEFVRISLDCGRVIVNMDSLDRFIERYPDYRFEWWAISCIVNECTLSNEFVEHVLRASPNSVDLLIHPNTIDKFGFGIVDRVFQNDSAPWADRDEMDRVIAREKVNVVENIIFSGHIGLLKKIISNPDTPDVVRSYMENWAENSDHPVMYNLIVNSPHSSVNFLSEAAKNGKTNDIRSAAQRTLTLKKDSGKHDVE